MQLFHACFNVCVLKYKIYRQITERRNCVEYFTIFLLAEYPHEKYTDSAKSANTAADLNAKERFMKGVFAVSSYRDN